MWQGRGIFRRARGRGDHAAALIGQAFDYERTLRMHLHIGHRARPHTRSAVVVLAYVAMLSIAVAGFFIIVAIAESVNVRLVPVAVSSSAHVGTASALYRALLAICVIVPTAAIAGSLMKCLRQPPVVGEVLAGIILGPSVLGWLAPHVRESLLPGSIAPFLSVYAQLGVVLYLLSVGLELDGRVVAKRGHAMLAISHGSIVVPFLLGSLLALAIYPTAAPPDVPFAAFALFIGVSMSVTAFPVLARILSDRGISHTKLGILALSCAAVDDITSWCLLALSASTVRADPRAALLTALLTVVFVAVVLVVMRPALRYWILQRGRSTELTRATLFLLLAGLAAATITEYIGIHGFFGAFLVGAVVPHRNAIAKRLSAQISPLVAAVFLPVFFAFSGMRTELGLLASATDWLLCGVVIAIACTGKFLGTAVAARFSGFSWREGVVLGVLMNTRGLVELIVLNVGLDLGVITPKLFTILVIMALVTTFLTTPALHWLWPPQPAPAVPRRLPLTP